MADLDRYLPDIAAGDAGAFASWVAGAEERLRLSLRSFAAAVDVEVVVQETLLRCWQVAPRVTMDGRGDSLLRLAVRIARNLAVDHTRTHHSFVADPPTLDAMVRAVSGAPALAAPDPHLRRAIEECTGELPERPRQALRCRLERGGAHSDRDLAESLGMRLNTFLKNVGRARQWLARCLEGKGVDLRQEMR